MGRAFRVSLTAPFGRLLTTTYPDGSYEQVGYDANSNVLSRRLRDGQTLSYSYDALDRRTLDTNPGGNTVEVNVSYSFDLLGNLLRASDQNGWFNAFEYDALGRTTRQYSNNADTLLHYDASGRLINQDWRDGFNVTYGYDNVGEMLSVADSTGLTLANYTYNNAGHVQSVVRGNGTTSSYAYDNSSRLSSLTHDVAGTANDLTLGFLYNPAGQIATRTSSNGAYSWTGGVAVSRSYTVNALNQYTGSGTVVPTYDARGNLTHADGDTYTFNSRNQLSYNGSGQLFYHNPLGLLGQEATRYNLDYVGAQLTRELDGWNGNQVLRRYVYGADPNVPLIWYEGSGTTDRRWLLTDERNSVVAIADGSGSVTAINSYDEYGIPGGSNQGRFQYAGQMWIPELAMYDAKARTYSPTLGRFLQPDPIGYGDGLNWYNYAHGDPVNETDPTGTAAPAVNTCPNGMSGSVAACQAPDIVVNGVRPQPIVDYCDTNPLACSIAAGLAQQSSTSVPYTGSTQGQQALQPQREQTRRISPCMQKFLASKGLGGPNLGSVVFHNGDGGSLAAKAAFAHGNPAITIQNNVYVAPGQWNNFREGTSGFFEETVHTMQWQQSGAENFGFAWLIGSAAGYLFTGDAHNSPLEAQAMGMSVDLAKAYSEAAAQCSK